MNEAEAGAPKKTPTGPDPVGVLLRIPGDRVSA
jgi:hypothetical protein